jgi:hypothetical protein
MPAEGVVAVKRYVVRAKRWAQGWELHIDGVGVTQVRSLARADQQVRDYLETLFERDMREAAIEVRPDLGGIEDLVAEARRRTRDAEDAQRTAADQARKVVRLLRDSGLSVDETAAVMGVSPGRVSQMAKATPKRRAPAERQAPAARQTPTARPAPPAARALPVQPAAKVRKSTAAAASRAVLGRSSSTSTARRGSTKTAAARSESTSRAAAGRAPRKVT